MPTKANTRKADQLKRARASAGQRSMTPGTVIGADSDLYYNVVDLDGPKRLISGLRAELERKGFDRVDPTPAVVGFDNAEVWAIDREVYNQIHRAAREERAQQRRKNAGISFLTRK